MDQCSNFDIICHCRVKEYLEMMDAYLDIETAGLSCDYAEITVIGIYLVDYFSDRLVQLVGEDVTYNNLLASLKGVKNIFTYNGSRFDLPIIKSALDISLEKWIKHHDLMYDCWRRNLKGGLKFVEQQLGIPRKLHGISGLDAVRLWWQYRNYDDSDALDMLLRYNGEDVMNLQVLRQRLYCFKAG